tara:strand:+ start:1863 stop:3104 length:1242 start_codon:yes stop_codon:yes gene_type:complete
MSLIIDMLKDLDKRNNHITPSTPPLVTRQAYSIASYDRYKTVFIVMALVMLTLSLIYFLRHHQPPSTTLALPNETSPQQTVAKNIDTSGGHPDAVMIDNVSFATKGSTTDITIQLDHDTLYRLTTNNDKNIVSLYIDNATAKSNLPTLIGADSGFKKISSSINQDLFKMTLELDKGAYIKSVNLDKSNSSPELVVSIANPEVHINHTAQIAEKKIKSPAIQSVITDQYQAAITLSQLGKKQEAIKSFTKLLGYYPDYNDARVALAAITLESGNAIQARKIIDDGLAMSPNYLPLVELKARLLTSEGKIKQALMVLQSEQPLITDAPSYHALIAALYSRENNHALAVNIYRDLVNINPHEGSWWFGLAVAQDKLGHDQDAIFAYTKAASEGRLNAQASSFLHSRLQALQENQHG